MNKAFRIDTNKAFTLVELLAVIVILAIILAIAVPGITSVTKSASKAAFKSDAIMVLKAINYQKLVSEKFDPTTINKDNLNELLGLSTNNYNNVTISLEDNTPIITIIGTGKWNGLVACGTSKNMRVVESTSECSTDLIPPIITILGDNPISFYIDESYSDAGATATDDKDGDITNLILTTSNVNPSFPGNYNVTYSVSDAGGNTVTVQRQVTVIDNKMPVISFDPLESLTYSKGASTTVTVTDVSGINNENLKYTWTLSMEEPAVELFTSIFTVNETINTPNDTSGNYYLWVRASDLAGNEVVKRSGEFKLDNTNPILTLNGDSIVTVNKGSSYTDASATATDEHSGIKGSVIATGSVNIDVVGSYTITYTVSDNAGNDALPITRTINVIDVSAPVITILGSNPTSINVGSAYNDAGATAIDDVDGDVTSKITTTSNVNPNVAGTYQVTYTVKDIANNTATSTRTINVIDNILPTIVFGTNGNATYATSRSTTVTVSDAHTGVNASSLKYLWNTSTVAPAATSFTTTFTNGGTISSPAGVSGGYYLWIHAKDNAGNTTIQRTNVFNLDNSVPTYTSVSITNVTSSGYDVYIYGVSDPHSGVNRVQFPTWTALNGQDDIQADWVNNVAAKGTNQGNGTWYYRVNSSSHNNESGTYYTHIYIYDNLGLSRGIDAGSAAVPSAVVMCASGVPNCYAFSRNTSCSCNSGYCNGACCDFDSVLMWTAGYSISTNQATCENNCDIPCASYFGYSSSGDSCNEYGTCYYYCTSGTYYYCPGYIP